MRTIPIAAETAEILAALRPGTVDAGSLIFAKSDQTPLVITREIYLHPEEQRRAVESVERLVFGPKLDPTLVSNAEVSEDSPLIIKK